MTLEASISRLEEADMPAGMFGADIQAVLDAAKELVQLRGNLTNLEDQTSIRVSVAVHEAEERYGQLMADMNLELNKRDWLLAFKRRRIKDLEGIIASLSQSKGSVAQAPSD